MGGEIEQSTSFKLDSCHLGFESLHIKPSSQDITAYIRGLEDQRQEREGRGSQQGNVDTQDLSLGCLVPSQNDNEGHSKVSGDSRPQSHCERTTDSHKGGHWIVGVGSTRIILQLEQVQTLARTEADPVWGGGRDGWEARGPGKKTKADRKTNCFLL